MWEHKPNSKSTFTLAYILFFLSLFMKEMYNPNSFNVAEGQEGFCGAYMDAEKIILYIMMKCASCLLCFIMKQTVSMVVHQFDLETS